MSNLIKLSNKIKTNLTDYETLGKNSVIINADKDDSYDINFIIPVRGRDDFLKPMHESFKVAKSKSNLNITYTVVEHSEGQKHGASEQLPHNYSN